ncbi:hypothetical protein T310_2848 [Rasamsonia emersonii CBS 393.64]|uniref:Fibroin-3 related protein n=1 Tax=Rasamsonia emersonii (strain ATCC 16479 / CBS 393.64 / IMI 116815) TaxID=1408163 RepID=A0A0F4YXW6_RASE3|nr:hypothetical protein T310_2848 [Rasamsonia emersonii CBS 393.64]KKA23122.1 hypothetical protein T310_2848 [Rasamsonia emersonii CBS 393.64]
MRPVDAMLLSARDAVSDIKSAPSTFSSWHNCMQKAYCKWPAIVGIIVGSLILISIVGCIISCVCCGVQCCRGCCGCFYDCCECCCGSSRHGGRSKYADPPAPYYHQPPPPPANMNYGYQQSPAPPAYRGPRTAQFDHPSSKVNDDALPAMPTWADAPTRRVKDTSPVSEDVEMNRLDAPTHAGTGTIPTTGRVSRGGYTELPSSAASPPPVQEGYRGAEPSHFPKPPSPQAAGYGPRAAPAPYRGFENPGPAPASRAPNFHTPRPYDGLAPSSPTARQPPYPSYDQPQQPQQTQQPYNALSPSIAAPRIPSPPAQQPAYAAYEPQPQQPYRAMSPRIASPRIPSPAPPTQPAHEQQPQQSYQAYSPGVHSTSPPPTEVAQETNDRPPSLLQAGRKPVPNSWRSV